MSPVEKGPRPWDQPKTPPPKKLADENLGKNLFGEFIKGLRGAISEKMKPKAVVESPVAILARRLAAGHTDSVGTHVADFLMEFEMECRKLRQLLDEDDKALAEAKQAAAKEEDGSPAEEAVAAAVDVSDAGAPAAAAAVDVDDAATAEEEEEEVEPSNSREQWLSATIETLLVFETSLLEALYDAGIAQPVEEALGAIGSDASSAAAGGGSWKLWEQRRSAVTAQDGRRRVHAAMPRYAQPLRERIHGEADQQLRKTREALRLRHPEVIGLREPLVSSGGVPTSTVLEASWVYKEARDLLGRLPAERTVAGKLITLSKALEALVGASRERCGEGLSADDLVPLLTLTLITAPLEDVGFEGFVLDRLLSDVLSSGRESYCACTLNVAVGFLRQVEA